MATISVLSLENKKVGEVSLSPEVFEQPIRNDVMHEVVLWQLASRRQGTHSTKTRAFVRGGGKKPFKQKGTGNARQGSSRSPLMPGGAKLFGPLPRTYEYTLPKKVKRLGLRSALSLLKSEGKITVVDSFQSTGKTKDLKKSLDGLGIGKALLVDVNEEALTKRSSRNLKKYRYISVDGLNVYDLLRFEHLVASKAAIAQIVKRAEQ
jgi:large subunit ribosomal protein L4